MANSDDDSTDLFSAAAGPAGLVRVELAQTRTAPFCSSCAADAAPGRPAFTVQAVSRPAAR